MAKGKSFSMKRDPLATSKKNRTIIAEKYESIFDYEKFEIIDLKNELIESEEKIFNSSMNIGKATFEIAEELYKVNKKLANRGSGTYMAWCASLGVNKDKSSVLLKKYSLYLETNKKEIMGLPIPVVKVLTGKKSNFTQADILEIVEDKKPSAKLKEVEKRYSQVANKKSCEIQEAEIIETIEDIIIAKEKELSFIDQDIKERKRNLKKRYTDREDLVKEIEELKLQGK